MAFKKRFKAHKLIWIFVRIKEIVHRPKSVWFLQLLAIRFLRFEFTLWKTTYKPFAFLVDTFQKSLQFRPDFLNWYRELRTKSKRELSQTQRGCQKPQLFSVAASLVLGIPLSRELREKFLRKVSLNGDWASVSPFAATSSKTVRERRLKESGRDSSKNFSQPRRFFSRQILWLEAHILKIKVR